MKTISIIKILQDYPHEITFLSLLRVPEVKSERLSLSHYIQTISELESTVTHTEVAEHLDSFTPGRSVSSLELEGVRDLLEHASEIRGLAALYIIERFCRRYHICFFESQNLIFLIPYQ